MTSFPQRSVVSVPHGLFALADLLGSPRPEEDRILVGVAPLTRAAGNELGFLADRKYIGEVGATRAGALLVSVELARTLDGGSIPLLAVEDPHRALPRLLDAFFPPISSDAAIHPTAILGKGVRLGRNLTIGPYAVVEEGVTIGDDARIGAHVVLGSHAVVGEGCHLHPHAVVYPRTILGKRVILHAGVQVGVDGFGYVQEGGRHLKVPQVGGCIIEDDVEIGANSTIDRGSIGVTRVANGAKIDNLVHLGHNVEIGEKTLITAQVGIAGSSKVGKGVLIGGQAGISGHLSIGDGARISAQAGVIGDIPAGETVTGFPARPRREFLRNFASSAKVSELLRRVKELEARLTALLGDTEGGGSDPR